MALVTGGSRGIGKAVAARLSEAGARVMLSSRKPEGLAEAAASIGPDVAWFATDAADRAGAAGCVQACLDTFGGLDVLVNNAGTSPYFGPLMDLDEARRQKTLQVNLEAMLVWTQLAWKAAMSSGGGSVVNMASIGGLTVEPSIGWYDVTKAAAIHLTRHLALELGPKVRVNAVAPGLVRTRFSRGLWEASEDRIAARLPLRRLGEPDDVAKAVALPGIGRGELDHRPSARRRWRGDRAPLRWHNRRGGGVGGLTDAAQRAQARARGPSSVGSWARLTLPMALRGSSATTTSSRGAAKGASWSFASSRSSESNPSAPLAAPAGETITYATSLVPHSGSGRPATATSRTPGCPRSTASTWAGQMFSPPEITASSRRP